MKRGGETIRRFPSACRRPRKPPERPPKNTTIFNAASPSGGVFYSPAHSTEQATEALIEAVNNMASVYDQQAVLDALTHKAMAATDSE